LRIARAREIREVHLKYIVTGASGFIGSKVAEMLLDQGQDVVGIDNMNDAYDVRLKQWRLDILKRRRCFEFYELDICDRAGLRSIFDFEGKLDGVINLAARAGVRQSLDDPWIYVETNCVGTLNLLEECRTRGINKFVLASTSSLYGNDNPIAHAEHMSTSEPLSPYAASKKAAESLCYSYHHLYGLDITVLRYFTVYGPAGRPDMSLFRFVQWICEGRPVTIFGDGRQSRDFTYVDDIARGTLAALKPAGFSIINLGSDDPAVLMDAVRIVEELTGRSAQIEFKSSHPADVPTTWADITRAREQLNWAPTTNLQSGIHSLVEWYNQNRSWARDIRTT
jgi:UDP-glucuronate 4-epimerase